MRRNYRSWLLLAACACFAVAVLTTARVLTIDSRVDWTDLGLLLGFLSFLA